MSVLWTPCWVGPCPAGGHLFEAQLAGPSSTLNHPTPEQPRPPHFSVILPRAWGFHWQWGSLGFIGVKLQELLMVV